MTEVTNMTVVEYAATAGKAWGEAAVGRNGDDMRRLREAVDYINTEDGTEALVAAYVAAGGDKATASRIRKIVTQARLNADHRAIVKDESSHSLQGCYKKIQEDLKGKKAETEPTEADKPEATPTNLAGDKDVDLPGVIKALTTLAAKSGSFVPEAAKLISMAVEMLQAWEAPSE